MIVGDKLPCSRGRRRLSRPPRGLEHSLSFGALDLRAQLLTLAHEALMTLELADDPVFGNPGSKALEKRVKGLTRAQAYLHPAHSPPFFRRPWLTRHFDSDVADHDPTILGIV